MKQDFQFNMNCESVNVDYSDEATDFHERKVPEAGSNYICWSVIFIDVLKNSENYYYY